MLYQDFLQFVLVLWRPFESSFGSVTSKLLLELCLTLRICSRHSSSLMIFVWNGSWNNRGSCTSFSLLVFFLDNLLHFDFLLSHNTLSFYTLNSIIWECLDECRSTLFLISTILFNPLINFLHL